MATATLQYIYKESRALFNLSTNVFQARSNVSREEEGLIAGQVTRQFPSMRCASSTDIGGKPDNVRLLSSA